MSTIKRALPVVALAALAFATLWFTSAGAAPAPEPRGPLGGELKVDSKYAFLFGIDTEQGYYGKVLAIDGNWVKIESYRIKATGKEDPQYEEEKDDTLWLNLAQVTVVREKPPSSVYRSPRPAGGRGIRGGGGPAGGGGGRGGPAGGGGPGGSGGDGR